MNSFAIASRRLRIAAALFRANAYHPDPCMIELVATAIEKAAAAFEAVPPGAYEELPHNVETAVTAAYARIEAEDYRVPAALVGYATEAVTGRPPVIELLNAASPQLALEDVQLYALRNTLIDHGHLASNDEEVLTATLKALMILHRKHASLARRIEIDNGRPCNVGKPAAEIYSRP
ncbi:hypothetical protein [Streptomyces sp. NPDC086782]|uniref:hypothetical protein n=1 Tax=Streptomyces sp. NPDC086782 TaxID=3365757 RepID=UPI0037FA6F60